MRFLGGLCVIFFFFLLIFTGWINPLPFQWDFFVYYDAALSWRMGLDPYNYHQLASHIHLERAPWSSFTYPPLSIFFFLPFTFFSMKTAAGIWMAVKFAFFLLLLRSSSWFHRFRWNRPSDIFLLVLGFNATLLIDFVTGNTSLLQFSLVWLALGISEREGMECYWQAGALFACAAFLKVQPLALSLIPFFYSWKKWPIPAVCIGIFFAYLGLNWIFFPEYSREFLREATLRIHNEAGLIAPSSMAFASDFSTHLGIPRLKMAIYGAMVAVTFFFTTRALRRGIRADYRALVALSLLSYLLLVPRVKSYEFLLVLPVAAYAIEAMRERFRAVVLFFLCAILYPTLGEGFQFTLISPAPVLRVSVPLFFHYLPFWQLFFLWAFFVHAMSGRKLESPKEA